MEALVLGTVANPVVLEANGLEQLKMYPNPFKDELLIQFNSNTSDNIDIQLINVYGQSVYAKTLEVREGANTLKINPSVSIGVYFLKINMNNTNRTYKVIKN